MITRNMLRALALATTCLTPLAAFADDFNLEPAPAPAPGATAGAGAGFAVGDTLFHGSAEFDVLGVVGNNPDQAGRYTGLNANGFGALGQFDLTSRGPWDSGATRYYDFTGNNILFQTGDHLGTGLGSDNGFQSSISNRFANEGSLGFKTGDQGTWGAGFYYDAITYTGNVIDSLYTINGNQGTLNNNLTPWAGATALAKGSVTSTSPISAQQALLQSAMVPVQVGTRRDIVGGDFKYITGEWTFSGGIRHEHKEGSMEESFDGPYGGTAFALPINYDTDRYDATAAYTTRQFQGSLQYTFSHFADNNLFVTLPYPISGTAKPYQLSAAYSTPPSNDAHYLTLLLADNDLVPKTRINLNARVGLEMQNDTFAPDTADPNPGTPVGLNSNLQGTSANSPDMMATVYQVKLSAASHPMADVNTRVYYGVDGRDVSLNQFAVNTGGTGGSAADSSPGGASNVSFVVPQDWLKQNAGGEVGYRILPESDTKVTVGYRFDAVDRSNAQVGHSSTNTASIALMSQIGPQVDGKISFDYADRTGSLSYMAPWETLSGSATSAGTTYSGAYYQAPMTSEAVTIRGDYTPMDSLSSSLFLQFKNENYTYPAAIAEGGGTPPLTGVGEGIKQDYALSVGPDVNYRPSKDVNLHLFYTYELLFYNNLGNGNCAISVTTTAPTLNGCTTSAGYFQNLYTSSTHTVGLSSEWKVNEKLKLRGDYTVSYGSVMFGEYNGVFVPGGQASYMNVSNYPDIDSLMNSVKLTATYEIVPDIELVLQGVFTSFRNNDWNDTANAVQPYTNITTRGCTAPATACTAAALLLTPGYTSPNYAVGVVMTGVKFKF